MERPLTQHIRPGKEPLDVKQYEKVGGYASVRTALRNMTPEDVIAVVKESNLRGRGGAGFPTGSKWADMPPVDDARRPRFLIADADEMEPGTFKDRLLLEGNPHQLIEGMILGAFAARTDVAFIFLRPGYALPQRRLTTAIAEAYEAGYLGRKILGTDFDLEMHLHLSAGLYICGEGVALIQSLEGKRAIPGPRAPRTTQFGLWGNPTLMNNVETFSNVPHIINHGADWFRGLSRSKDGGTKIYGASGKVKRPGTWELPMGTTMREVLEEHAGGMRDGVKFRAVQPGGASTDFLLDEHLDTPMDFDSLPKVRSRLGTANMIVLDDQTCPVGMVLNLERFFARESCGWCTPCREGIPWTAHVLKQIEQGNGTLEDLDLLETQTRLLGPGRTFCALAPGAMEPLQSALKFFREDFERHISLRRCPWR